MPTSVRRSLAAASIALLVPALGACGFNEQTDQVYQPAVGVNDRSGNVDVLGAVVVATEEGKGLFVASLVNSATSKSDKLTSISGSGVQATVGQPVELKPDTLVNLAKEGPIEVTGSGIKEGSFVRLSLSFQNGQKTDLNVPVVAQANEFASVTPAPSPSASSSPSSSSSPSKGAKSSSSKPKKSASTGATTSP
jgi:hypothetical protein